MIRIIILSLVFFVPFFSTAFAASDSVSTALEIVNGFYAEADGLMEGVDGAVEFREPALREKEETVSELRSIGWSKKPSRSRYQEVFGIVDAYTTGVVSSIESLKAEGPAVSVKRLDEIAEHLKSLRVFKLAALEKTLELESYEKKGPKPVPMMDKERTPFEDRPEEAPGIWYR